jgi:peptidoglycan/LPS O-acetylase OafA/YrhL
MYLLNLNAFSYFNWNSERANKINKFLSSWHGFKIDSMAIGALGAYFAIDYSKYLKFIFSKLFQYFLYISIIPFLIIPHLLNYQVYSLFFILLILNLTLNDKSIFKLEYPILNFLGKISYGIYIYHAITIVPSIKIVMKFFSANFLSELLACILSIGLTVTIAWFSYTYFESYFLKLKEKWSKKNV